jgi:hypothetical protein
MIKIDKETILKVALVAGIVTLAMAKVQGWGWLVFALLLTI